MTVEKELNTECVGCGALEVVGVYEKVYTVGESDPVDVVPQGCRCKSCGLQFVTESTLELLELHSPTV